MPVQTSSRPFLAPLPSFMSVFGEGANMRILEEDSPSRQTSSYPASDLKPADSHFLLQHQHRDSISTSNSESTESSPTTTISTLDSSMSEPSSTSSPESPMPSMPVSHPLRHCGEQSPEEHAAGTLPHPLSNAHRSHSPAKRARNTKNLSLNMSATTRPSSQPARTSAAASFSPSLSAPPSPSFIVPPKPPKRRPSKLGLTIMTPGLAEHKSSLIPPTPSAARPNKLRHFQSSPSLSAFSPTAAPEGGMHFPAFSNERGFGRFSKPKQLAVQLESPFKTPEIPEILPKVGARLEELEEENDDAPLSHEAKKSPAYPSGPVCIYDPLVYLYLEPNDTEASEFDVVLNVAREVKNPFTLAAEKQDRAAAQDLSGGNLSTREELLDAKDSGISGMTATSFELGQTDSSTTSPSTPKAKRPPPEYIHIPWDHNTNIVDDLLKLVEVIDNRVKRGKRVLVHCQCGVSRSASLIVAYGLYKNPTLSVQQAYDAVKQRSRWIGPNMNLIYQLSEFKTKLSLTTGASSNTALRARRNMMAGRSNSVSHGSSVMAPLPGSFIDDNQPAPQSAPLPAERDRNSMQSPPRSPTAPQLAVSRDFDTIAPAPLTAPSEVHLMQREDRTQTTVGSWPPAIHEGFSYPRATPDEATYFSTKSQEFEPSDNANSRYMPTAPSAFSAGPERSRSEPFGQLPSYDSQNDVDQAMFDAPPTPTLMSPRAAEFTASPFHRVGMGEMRPSSFDLGGLASPRMFDEDPRSPAQRGEAPITRNIFDVL